MGDILSARQKVMLEYIRMRNTVTEIELRKFYSSKEYLKMTLDRLWLLGYIKPNYGTWVYSGEIRGQRILDMEVKIESNEVDNSMS